MQTLEPQLWTWRSGEHTWRGKGQIQNFSSIRIEQIFKKGNPWDIINEQPEEEEDRWQELIKRQKGDLETVVRWQNSQEFASGTLTRIVLGSVRGRGPKINRNKNELEIAIDKVAKHLVGQEPEDRWRMRETQNKKSLILVSFVDSPWGWRWGNMMEVLEKVGLTEPLVWLGWGEMRMQTHGCLLVCPSPAPCPQSIRSLSSPVMVECYTLLQSNTGCF